MAVVERQIIDNIKDMAQQIVNMDLGADMIEIKIWKDKEVGAGRHCKFTVRTYDKENGNPIKLEYEISEMMLVNKQNSLFSSSETDVQECRELTDQLKETVEVDKQAQEFSQFCKDNGVTITIPDPKGGEPQRYA